ncbi:hypothetical protein BD410DRAFT_785311 [Rickenella mellea]|uniref:Uncharacterized protein n=1 Tax=Rickenella mellea TaxID=50990 RepID=A0A4Y7QDP1_9AGAM|nr:hypothetical protein BD410DRAFT_785311 [Rickenella mellea]
MDETRMPKKPLRLFRLSSKMIKIKIFTIQLTLFGSATPGLSFFFPPLPPLH